MSMPRRAGPTGLGAVLGLVAPVLLALVSINPVAVAAQETTSAADAGKVPPKLAERLTPAQQKIYLAYQEAHGAFEHALRAYWRKVESKRSARKAKRKADKVFTADDYVTTYPPKYTGPELPVDIAKIVA